MVELVQVGWLVLTALLFEGVQSVPKMLRRGEFGMMGSPPILEKENIRLPTDQWFTQQQDHFDPTNNNTWQQLFQEVDDYYVPGGPVFLLLGGEGAASAVWLIKGNWVNYAKENNALMFQLEHRFYGKSWPTSDLSVASLRYLSSPQALADAAYFIEATTRSRKLPQGTKWIVFGGSYSGNLAAWMRDKYPNLVHGAMSASGPVLAKVDFYEYMDVVRRSLNTYGKRCTRAVEAANEGINKLLGDSAGRKVIEKYFSLCDSLNVTNKFDIYNLLESLADNLAGIVQYNKDNRGFRSSTANITIDTVCDIMVNESLGNPVIRYAAVNSLLMEAYELDCLSYKYNDFIEELTNTSWESMAGSYGERQWTYQTCTEFGYYQTSERPQQLFGKDFPLKFFTQQCYDIFGDSFTKKEIYAGVQRTNIEYGGKNLKATRVVYVHGSIDPWHALGIIRTRVPQSPAIFIKGTAHCANMYPPADTDLPALTAARKEVGDLIKQWLQQY